MKRLAAIAILVAAPTAVRAAEGTPSEQVLADMGLAGLQILDDAQASDIRGSGFDASSLNGFAHYRQSINNFHENVADFRERVADFQGKIDNHVANGKHSFEKSKKNFHKHVKKFHHTVKKFRHANFPKNGHGGMKPPKHSRGGKI